MGTAGTMDTAPRKQPAACRRAVLAGLAALAGATASGRAEEPLRFGIFPYLPPLALDRLFAPVLTALAAVIHRPLLMRTKATFEEFAAALGVRAYDTAFVHPFLALHAFDSAAYRPLLRVDAPFRLAFIGRAEGHRHDLADLRGGTLATPPPLSAAAILAEVALGRRNMRPETDYRALPTASKTSCIQKVLRGEADACALPLFAVQQLQVAHDARLRVFGETSLAIGLSIIAATDLDARTAARLSDEICAWSETEAGRLILAHAGWPGFLRAQAADYAPAREALRVRDRFAGR